jgi:hypothetical protein
MGSIKNIEVSRLMSPQSKDKSGSFVNGAAIGSASNKNRSKIISSQNPSGMHYNLEFNTSIGP